jgi:hypothetical protein
VREWFISRAVMCRLCWGIVQRALVGLMVSGEGSCWADFAARWKG